MTATAAAIVSLNGNKLLYSTRPITESAAVAHHPLSVTALKLNSHHYIPTRTGTGYCKNCSFSTSIKPRTAPRTRRHCTPVANEFDTEEDDTQPQINTKPPDEEETESLGVKAALCMLKFYKREISPLLPKSCRYVPTCSEYSMEAYKKYGVVKGTILTTWRICRCNPFGGSGFDPPRWFGEERLPEQ